MPKWNARIDANQPDIVKEIRKIPGFSVTITSNLGNGFVDIVVGYCEINGLYEIKDPAKPPSAQQLTEKEQQWHDGWHGQKAVVTTATQIIVDMRKRAAIYRQGELLCT
jgi:hypothetical protein